MITQENFSDLMQYLNVDYEGVITSKSEESVASKCYDLSKQQAVEFAAWILNESFVPSFNSLGERSYKAAYSNSLNKSPEELFELYLTENK